MASRHLRAAPFRAALDIEASGELALRLGTARLPADGGACERGVPGDWLAQVIEDWRAFDPLTLQARLDRLTHLRAEVGGVSVQGAGVPGTGMRGTGMRGTGMRGTGMRGTGRPRVASVAAALAAAALAAGCSVGQPSGSRATVASCYAFAVQALDQHVTVTSVPPACRGLGHEQINQAVDRAIRTVVGPHRKTVARRLAHEEAAYLSYLVTVVPPRSPAPPVTAPSRPSSRLPLRLAALVAWAVTVAAGAWLLAGWLARGGLRRRYIRVAGVPRPVVIGHFTLALTGLGIWIGFLATGLAALAWAAVGVVLSVAGLGMATLGGGLPEGRQADGVRLDAAGPAAPAPVVARPAAATESAIRGPAGAEPTDAGPRVAGPASTGPAGTGPTSIGPARIGSTGAGPASIGSPSARSTAIAMPAGAGKPVAVIALHGALAATTILLVVLAAISA